MGRTNKLVDGCYSYWQGALFPLLQQLWPLYLQQLGLPHAPKSESGFASKPLPYPATEPALALPLPVAAQAPPEQAAAEVQRLQVCSGPFGFHSRPSWHVYTCLQPFSCHSASCLMALCAPRRTWQARQCRRGSSRT